MSKNTQKMNLRRRSGRHGDGLGHAVGPYDRRRVATASGRRIGRGADERFDATTFPTTFSAEVKGYDCRSTWPTSPRIWMLAAAVTFSSGLCPGMACFGPRSVFED